jgi:hypothetical protein
MTCMHETRHRAATCMRRTHRAAARTLEPVATCRGAHLGRHAGREDLLSREQLVRQKPKRPDVMLHAGVGDRAAGLKCDHHLWWGRL